MDIAKAMYKGGKIIHANECDSSSYKNLGLLCPFCSLEVYLRKGDIRKPYFAHFHTTSSRQVEQCELRASVYGNSTETSNIEGRGQRIEIFKKHFLRMISIDGEHISVDLQLNNWMNTLKVNTNNITMQCTEYFLTHRQAMEDKYIIRLKDKQILLQQQIALEAMNYLCVKSNHVLLNYILNYSIYKLYNQQHFKLLMQEKSIKAIAEICHYAAKIIITNPWLEAFALVKDTNSNSQVINTNIITKIALEKTRTNVTILKSQVNKKHTNGGYPDAIKTKMPKMSTGTKLATKLQGKIDTSQISKPVRVPTIPYPVTIQLLQSGSIILKQLTTQDYSDITIGHVTDYYYQGDKLVFNWNYYDRTLKYKCNQLDAAINRHLGKDRQEVIRIVAANNRATIENQADKGELTPQQKFKLGNSNRKREARKARFGR